jgi:mannose/fructose/N-acetylgalactosamine-specific phosphotransferase system component IIB
VSHENPIWRIDDRLIHGQVIIGWCGQLPIEQLIVLDDEIAVTDWEKNLMLMAAPPGLPTLILQTSEISSFLKQLNDKTNLTLILFKSPQTIQTLLKQKVNFTKINIGGIHFREDRVEFLPYLYLSKEEVQIFKELMEAGIYFECQDLPTSPMYDLKKVIEKKKIWK